MRAAGRDFDPGQSLGNGMRSVSPGTGSKRPVPGETERIPLPSD